MPTDPFNKMKMSLAPIVELNDQEWLLLYENIVPVKLNKDDHCLKAGQLCDFVAYIIQGTLIYYKLLENGKESTTDFGFPGDWITDNRSRLNNSPSFLNIKAVENSELFVIKNKNLELCYKLVPKLERLGRILTEQAFVKITQQSIDLQTLPAKERYDKLMKEHPEIIQNLPLYQIANYLGVAPKSLSRIRNK